MLGPLLGASRYLIIIAVIGALIAATTLLVFGLAEALKLVASTVETGEVSRKVAKSLAIEFIEIIDLFLMATVFLIVALGLYELFISTEISLPAWLVIRDLDDLKSKLISVVVVVMAVLFLGQVVTWDGERDLLGLGVGIGAVIAALTWFLTAKTSKTQKDRDSSEPESLDGTRHD